MAADAIYEIDFQHDLPTQSLARFASTNVDPYTNFVASIMLHHFQLPIKGQRHISAALTNIPVFSTADDRLQFGWGNESMMRTRYMHIQGYEHATVMIALSGTFHELYATEVLHAMVVQTARPKDMVPHLEQWRCLVRAGNGAFASSEFNLLVEDLIRLDPYKVGAGGGDMKRRPRCSVPPATMAKTLLALSKVTSKKEKQLTLVGGAVIGWFAAIAEYFYDLKVSLKSCAGVHLHGVKSVHDAELVLFYHETTDLEIVGKHAEVEVVDSVQQEDLAHYQPVQFLPFGGRIEWQALLPKVFGQAYHRLDHEEARHLHTIIGATARCLEDAVVKGKISRSNNPTSSSYGIGFLNNITAWLPLLQRGQGRMERQLRKSPEEAGAAYVEASCRLRGICQCTLCSISESQAQPKDGYCLLVIVETIVALGLATLRMIVTKNLFPSREGVQGLYQNQVQKHQEAKSLDPRGHDWFEVTYGNELDASDSRRLQNAAQLFSGTRPERKMSKDTVGIAHEGICAYMSRLEKSDRSLPSSEDRGLIRVVSGGIFARLKLYSRINASPVSSEEDEEGLSWEEHRFDHLDAALFFK